MTHLFKFLIIPVAFITMSITLINEEDSCTGAVGDVKYSLLDPSKFREVNGDCWVLMDGRSLSNETTLRSMGFSEIPDAQGVFIRSMELRSTERRDVDRAFGSPVGHYQADMFARHEHLYGSLGRVQCGLDNGTCYAANRDNVWTTSVSGGNETRPKNIALYTYARVD